MLRLLYLFPAIFFAFFALLTRADFQMPVVIVRYAGDYLWGIMLYFLLCALLPTYVGFKNLLLALFISYSVESLQLYQADWIMKVRANTWGGLLLGHGFLWSDILLYTLGNITGFAISLSIRVRHVKAQY